MIVISDTSAITSLAAIGHLFLLKELYKTVIIPEAVYQELFGPPISAGAQEAKNYDWIQIKKIEKSTANDLLLITLNNDLDKGESEAIALALELKADLMLIDERLGRDAAKRLGLRVTGVIGVLLEAKAQGFIANIRPLLDDLRDQAGFRIADALYDRALELAHE